VIRVVNVPLENGRFIAYLALLAILSEIPPKTQIPKSLRAVLGDAALDTSL
jgi:hypothetical protein